MKNKLTEYTAVEWMHPSWRDLVIDHLASDDQARETFLRRCGLQGFLLALSAAGGATGQRQSPLLLRAEDWDALIASVPRVMESERKAAASILAMLYEALQIREQGSASNGNKESVKLTSLTETILTYLRERWNKNGVDSASLLDRYYSLSELLPSLPPSPNLQDTWKAFLADASANIKSFDPDQIEIRLSEFNEWMDLASTIRKNEPRFLRQVGFPNDFRTDFSELIPSLRQRAELEFDFDDADECREEQSRLEALATLAEKIALSFPHIADEARKVAFFSRINERRVEGRRERFEEEREPDDEDMNILAGVTAPVTVPADRLDEDPFEEEVSIDKLFEDL
jgi:hypothetical protein